MKKVLIVLNPCAGVKRANKYMTDIISLFCDNGYICTVQTTKPDLSGYDAVMQFGEGHELIVVIGGDGTYNEVVAGVIDKNLSCPIGYIPAGTTNDFGSSLGLPKNIMKAAQNILDGKAQNFDVGSFNGRKFTYVASCGAFSSTSYTTPTDLKNVFGHLAYVLEGIKSLPEIQPEHLRINYDGNFKEDDYIFAAVCNSTSLGGILKLDKKYVDMNDGLFEILLVRSPNNIAELATAVHDLNMQNFNNSSIIELITASKIELETSRLNEWSLDGEWQKGSDKIVIENLKDAIKLIVPKEK